AALPVRPNCRARRDDRDACAGRRPRGGRRDRRGRRRWATAARGRAGPPDAGGRVRGPRRRERGMNALVVARFTLQEAISRRLVLAGLLLSGLFLALYALGFWFIYGIAVQNTLDPRSRAAPLVAATILTILGLYAVNFLASFLALFLSVGGVSGEVDSGTLLAVMARPLRRSEFVVGRWLGYALILVVYVVAMVGGVLLLAWGLADYGPADPVRAIALMMLSAL